MRSVLLLVALAGFSPVATAQVRTIPQEAKRGQISHLQDMLVEIDGKPQLLSPGAQIRDTDNRLVLPVSLPGNSDVKYLVDDSGMVHRVWILTGQESAQSAPPAKPQPEKPQAEKPATRPIAK